MMLTWVLVLALQPGADQGSAPTTAELRALAKEHEEADRFVEAGETYLRLARRPDVRPRDELFEAHSSFDSAFIASGDSRYLCRALQIAERVVDEGKFDHQEQQKFWAEVLADDLARLADDAVKKKTANCRFDAAGRRLKLVALIADDEPPQPIHANLPGRTEISTDGARPPLSRRHRAHTAAGAVFTGLGIGFLGVFAGTLAVKIDQVQAIHKQAAVLEAQGRRPTAYEEEWVSLREATARSMQPVMISAAVAGGVSLATGAIVLATRRARRLAVSPFGGVREAGLLLQGRF